MRVRFAEYEAKKDPFSRLFLSLFHHSIAVLLRGLRRQVRANHVHSESPGCGSIILHVDDPAISSIGFILEDEDILSEIMVKAAPGNLISWITACFNKLTRAPIDTAQNEPGIKV